ncbi:PP2C family protein-serine/threonine phosphatase [Thermoflexus sp.]|uniref:PP2C family protein-serine/threonine phosphatase n=1 Tax=Thermoflexus sp. TaxID=1969742 RepID=UPI0035E4141A
MIKLRIEAFTQPGHARDHNEDRLLIGNEIIRDGVVRMDMRIEEGDRLLLAIADGMGGHQAGEVAAEMVLGLFRDKVALLNRGLTEEQLEQWIYNTADEIHMRLLEEGASDPHKKGMGSTLVGLLFYEARIYYINVGDSRLYRFRDGYVVQVSRDQSLRALTGVESKVILNCFGGKEGKIYVEFNAVGGRYFEDDVLFLCSDGFSDVVSEEEIEALLARKDNALDQILDVLKQRQARDDASAIIVRIKTPDQVV